MSGLLGFGAAALVVRGLLDASLGSIGFVSSAEIYRTIATANYAVVTAYELPRTGGMTAALELLCRRGGRADVILAGDAFIVGQSVRSTDDAAAEALGAAGCHVRRATQPLHIKLAYVGGVPYLADRNWGRKATILRIDDAADRALIADTLQNRPGTNGTLATRKGDALALEAQTISETSGPLFVESESFGSNNAVYAAIEAALASRRPVSLIVAAMELRSSATERDAIMRLVRAGAQVRSGSTNAKMAVGLNGAFCGSSNATGGYPDQIDWGRRISSPLQRAELSRRFTIDWASARPI